jgi:hypothetical protein
VLLSREAAASAGLSDYCTLQSPYSSFFPILSQKRHNIPSVCATIRLDTLDASSAEVYILLVQNMADDKAKGKEIESANLEPKTPETNVQDRIVAVRLIQKYYKAYLQDQRTGRRGRVGKAHERELKWGNALETQGRKAFGPPWLL